MEDARVDARAGWFPDPSGAHELRYHNGTIWTADVATDGVRGISPLPDDPGSRRTAQRALAVGLTSMCLGWIPFVSVVAFVAAVVAVILGLRARSRTRDRSTANAAIVTGAVGVAFSLVATWIAVVIVDEVARFDDPGRYDLGDVECTEVDGVTRATGMITNLDDTARSYTIEVDFDDRRSASVELDEVAPGETVSFVVDQDFRFRDPECEVSTVRGPRPFGLNIAT